MSERNFEATADEAVGTAADWKDMLRSVRAALQTKTAKGIIFLIQFAASFLTLIYFKGVVQMAYRSLFYRLEIPAAQSTSFCVSLIFTLLGFGALMLFTRRQIVTRLVIMCAMPFYFPIFLFNYTHKVLIIPLAIFIVITYIGSGAGEGVKTILGAVYLMIYILGAFLFLTVQGAIQPNITETVVERGFSQQGSYRYSVVKVDDRADGHTYVAIEPNTCDLHYDDCTWYAKGYSKTIYLSRPKKDFKTEWSVKSRAEITRELLLINPYTTFTLNAEQMKKLGLDQGFTKEYKVTSLTRRQRKKLGIAIQKDLIGQTAEEAGLELKESTDTVTLTFAQMEELGLSPTLEKRLSSFSDENLATLGVPEQNDVLTVNGKVVFRQYIAVLERTYDSSNRSLTAFLESNDVPEINQPVARQGGHTDGQNSSAAADAADAAA